MTERLFSHDNFHTTRRRAVGLLAGAVTGSWLTGRVARADLRVGAKLRPQAVAFDVIATLFDLAPAAQRFRDAGLPRERFDEWYARLARDAGALNATGVYKPFAEVAAGTTAALLADAGLAADEKKVAAFVAAFAELIPYPDVAQAFETLKAAGVPILAVTNGSAETTKKLFAAAKLAAPQVVSIDDVKAWKPAAAVYKHAVTAAKVDAGRLAMVAAHDWDVHAAGRAGLVTGFVARKAGYSPTLDRPHVRGPSLREVVDALLALPRV